jgi:PAS domain S-box-containing protein
MSPERLQRAQAAVSSYQPAIGVGSAVWLPDLLDGPMPVAVFRGPGYVVEFANAAFRAAGPVSPAFLERLDRVLQTGIPLTEREMPTAGETWHTFSFLPRGDSVLVQGCDVTELVISRQRLSSTLEHAPIGILLAGAPNGRVLLANRGLLEILGEPLTVPNGWPLMRAINGEVVRHQEIHHRREDGTRTWLSVTATPIRDTGGAITGAVLVVHDIDLQKKAEKALAESERQFRLIAEAMPQLVWTTRADGYHDYFNKRWYEYTGTQPGETSGELWSNLLHPDDRLRTLSRWHQSLHSGEDYEIEYRFRRGSDGMYRWFLGRAMPLQDSQGKIVRWFGTCTDIHDQKENEAALLRSNDELEQFAYAVSHDLQEPLRMLLMYSTLLKRRSADKLDATANLYVDYLQQGGRRLEALLSDLRSYMRVSHATPAEDGSVRADAGSVLQRVLASLEPQILESDAAVEAGPLPSVAVEVFHLEQLLQNILSNAIKYRGPERPLIHLSAQRAREEWVFSVTDNGIGIDPQYASQIFGIFKRLHGQKYPGTGIGLAICQKIVERYGGDIWVKSELGRGSTFFFTLPASPEDASDRG